MSSGRIGALFFDVGETLIDESRMWRGWAAYLGVTADAFQAALQDVIAKDENHRAVFERFRPGFDIKTARHERAAAGDRDMFAAQDLYVDAAPCLRALRERGYRVGIAGNQPEGAVEVLRSLDLAADFVASSSSLRVEKPAAEFFRRLAALADLSPQEIAYVGDRLDNDILPARTAGMATVFLRRGPWAKVHAGRPEAALADITVDTLSDLPDAIARLDARVERR
jgi:HAD superfamily hydrolase (TIGR01549 family)